MNKSKSNEYILNYTLFVVLWFCAFPENAICNALYNSIVWKIHLQAASRPEGRSLKQKNLISSQRSPIENNLSQMCPEFVKSTPSIVFGLPIWTRYWGGHLTSEYVVIRSCFPFLCKLGDQSYFSSLQIIFRFRDFLAALAALYLTLVSEWVSASVSHCHFWILRHRVTFETWNPSDIWSEWCLG